jgi:hypothetical protein
MFCANFFRTVMLLVCMLAAIALLLASNIGTIGKQMTKSSIFLLELNTKGIDIASLYPKAGSVSISELGIAEAYIFGMYGYCRGVQGQSTTNAETHWEDIHFTSSECTPSSTSYTFDPLNFMIDEINEHNTLGIKVTESDLNLPGGLAGYVKTASHISQVIYICSIIAICLLVLSVMCSLLCWCIGSTALIIFLQNLAFVSAVISTGCATGAFKYIESEFNKYGTSFGVHAQLSRNYLVLAWLGTGMILLSVLVTTVTQCCCCVGRPVTTTFDRVL